MRHLMLLRHAKTERDSASGLDRDRQLSTVGRNDAPALGRFVRSQALVPDLALISPAARARETLELFAAEMPKGIACEIVHDLYGAEPSQLLQIVRMAAAFGGGKAVPRLMVVAHNPGLHEFALALTGSGSAKARQALSDNLPTSGLALIGLPADDWADISFRSGELQQLVSPATLRERLK